MAAPGAHPGPSPSTYNTKTSALLLYYYFPVRVYMLKIGYNDPLTPEIPGSVGHPSHLSARSRAASSVSPQTVFTQRFTALTALGPVTLARQRPLHRSTCTAWSAKS